MSASLRDAIRQYNHSTLIAMGAIPISPTPEPIIEETATTRFLAAIMSDPTHRDTRFPADDVANLPKSVIVNDVPYDVVKRKRGDIYTVSLKA